LVLAFVVFNPGDLYYLGYKKIIIIIITERRWFSVTIIAFVSNVGPVTSAWADCI